MTPPLIIYWARRDLRIKDNRALIAATKASKDSKAPILPLFFIEPYMTSADSKFQFGYPSRYFLAHAIPEFTKHFETFGVFHNKPAEFFIKLSKKYTLEIHVNEDIHPDFYKQIKKIKDSGIPIKLYRDQLTISKDTITSTGNKYSIFTPFKNAVWNSFVAEQEDKTPTLSGINFQKPSDTWGILLNHTNPSKILKIFSEQETILVGKHNIDILKLGLPKRDLSKWYVSESDALKHFDMYLKTKMEKYTDSRNNLAEDGTSKMSLALAWGLVSSRTLIAKMKHRFKSDFDNRLSSRFPGAMTFISELIWREFYKYLWFHKPELFDTPFQEKKAHIAWVPDKEAYSRFISWITGKTGYPIVDAAVMQLAHTGWMHNRTRMVVSSILAKNLGVDWRWGQEYFRAMLIDLDESSNNGGWQWGASVGADPKPIRIFNPYIQAKKFDPDNVYQKTWLDSLYLENPPTPIIEHKDARSAALERYGL